MMIRHAALLVGPGPQTAYLFQHIRYGFHNFSCTSYGSSNSWSSHSRLINWRGVEWGFTLFTSTEVLIVRGALS